MTISIPEDWIEVEQAKFDELLSNTQWVRDNWGNGSLYNHRHNGVSFAFQCKEDGKCYVNPEIQDKQ